MSQLDRILVGSGHEGLDVAKMALLIRDQAAVFGARGWMARVPDLSFVEWLPIRDYSRDQCGP